MRLLNAVKRNHFYGKNSKNNLQICNFVFLSEAAFLCVS